MMPLQHDAHVSGLAETRLARAALRLPCSGVLSLKTRLPAAGRISGQPEIGGSRPSNFSTTSSRVEHRTANPTVLGSNPKSSRLTASPTYGEPAASRPCRRLRPKVGQARKAPCAGADTARSQSLSPGTGTANGLRAGSRGPQPGADGGGDVLKPRPAIFAWAAAGNLISSMVRSGCLGCFRPADPLL